MSVALIVTTNGEAERLLPWAWRLAVSESMDLLVIRVSQKEEAGELSEATEADEIERLMPGFSEQWQQLTATRTASMSAPAIEELAAKDSDEPLPALQLSIMQLTNARPDSVLIEQLPRIGATHVIIPLDERIRDGHGSWKGSLFRNVGCSAVFMRAPAKEAAATLKRILVPTAGGQDADAALRLAVELGEHHDAEVTALFVERPVGRDSKQVGERILKRNVDRVAGKGASVLQKVIVAENLIDGIREEMNQPFDLVLIGAFRNRTIRRIFFGSISNELFSGPTAPAFAAVRAAMPASTRLQRWLQRCTRRVVPQLDREGRVKIVERVESSSKWDFDFVALTCLSTLIAALGLAGNQAPVIIGAMLVAPLMTPLVAAGLSLVQGNASLIKDSIKSVALGFLLAFFVGCVVGFLVPMEKVPTEVLNRTHPTLLDLSVALVSGIAAAYAMSRPNLLSALPGVAIAAALVPPIATAGLSVALALNGTDDAYHHWVHATGAIVLFATNIVAIVLGTAVALWAVGIQPPGTGRPNESWTRWLTVALMVVLVGLGFAVSHKHELESVTAAMNEVAGEFTRDHRSYATIIDVRRGPSKNELIVDLESDGSELRELPHDLLHAARTAMGNDQLQLRLQIKNVVRTGGL